MDNKIKQKQKIMKTISKEKRGRIDKIKLTFTYLRRKRT